MNLYQGLAELNTITVEMSDLGIRRWSGRWRTLKKRLAELCRGLQEFDDDPDRKSPLYREFTPYQESMRLILIRRRAQKAWRWLDERYGAKGNHGRIQPTS